ncbi:hypothetical protein B0H10DRAFT_613499 [Mycena sp. CBHHK59/15]|nr:hypothetical protein B0H10DRAFT_613499 [Mycena sp. CBHHK59/15]
MGHNPGSSLPFMYDLREIQSPDMARRASPQDARFIDPVPIIELPPFSGRNERFGPTHLDLCCYVDMFRLPINSDAAGAANSWTYYTYEGSGADRSAVLRHTSFPPRFPYQFTVGRHIVTEAETALLSGEKCVSSYILPDRRLVFIFTVSSPAPALESYTMPPKALKRVPAGRVYAPLPSVQPELG